MALAQVSAVDRPDPMLLHSSYTAFTNDNTLNTSTVPLLAAQAKKMGVSQSLLAPFLYMAPMF
jgi:hypothetical protein